MHRDEEGEQPAALDDIEFGYIGSSLVIRAAFILLPFREPLSSLTDDHIDQRIALTRFIAHAGLQLLILRMASLNNTITVHAVFIRQ